MTTFQALTDRVSAELIDVPNRTATQIASFVNQAVRKLQFRHDFNVCKVSTAVLTTTVGVRVLAAVPSDFLRFRKEKPYVITNHGRVYYLAVGPGVPPVQREFGTGIAGGVSNSEIDGPPEVLTLSEASDVQGTRNFEIYPLPDGRSLYTAAPAGEYRIKVPYIRQLPDLVNPGDTNWFTNNAEEYIIYLAVSNGFFFNHDVNNGKIWFDRAAGEVRDILARDKNEAFSGNDTLNISFDALGPKTDFGDSAFYRGYR